MKGDVARLNFAYFPHSNFLLGIRTNSGFCTVDLKSSEGLYLDSGCTPQAPVNLYFESVSVVP